MRRLLHLSMLFAILTQCNAQEFKSNLALTSGKSSFNMPFELVDNRIFIDVQLNGKGPFKFILDTGGYAQVSLEAARAAMLRLDEQEQGTGVGQSSVTAWRTTIAEMRIGDIRLTDQEARAFSYADARHVFGSRRFDGVIGLPVFEHFVVKADYENHMLTFIVPERFAYSGEGTLVPFELTRFVPLVDGEIDGVTARFGFDTGSRSSLLLAGPFVESNPLREKYAARFEAVAGWGIGGPVRSQVVRAKTLKLTSETISNIVTLLSLQKSGTLATSRDAGLVGGGVLKRFNITFDYSRRRLILERNRNFGNSDKYDRAGMWLSLSEDGRSFEVLDVVVGGPAAKAGIKAGDHILAVDGQSAESLDLPALRMEIVNGVSIKQLRLKMNSEGNLRNVTVMLWDLL
jgi:hypothetical protein